MTENDQSALDEAKKLVHAAQVAHFAEVVVKAEELRSVINGRPDLWLGGLPPVLNQVDHLLTHNIAGIRSTFGLEAPAETEA